MERSNEEILLEQIEEIMAEKKAAGIIPDYAILCEISIRLHWEREDILSTALNLEMDDKIRVGRTLNDIYMTTDVEDLFKENNEEETINNNIEHDS